MKASSKRAELRMSQLITTFGPGAMVDLPTRSVIIGGLDRWDMHANTWRQINEPRAAMLLQERLKEKIAPGATLTLRTPPLNPQAPGKEPPGIGVTVFPTWFVADEAQIVAGARRRRLVKWIQLDPARGRLRVDFPDLKSDVRPIRFVAACRHGHIQDIDWSWVVHGAEKCHEALWLEEHGTTGEPRNTRVVCDCGKSLSLMQAQDAHRLGKCRGHQPWLTTNADGCEEELRFLTRTATNAYFPQVLTVISLPAHEDELMRRVGELWDSLGKADNIALIRAARLLIPQVNAALEGFSDEAILAAVEQFRTAVVQDLEKKPKFAEFELLASGRPVIGENSPTAKLHAETLGRDAWATDDERLEIIGSVVAVHRLREVSCLYGFTRFEAAPTSIDGDVEEIYIDVNGAPIASELSWVPAVEQFGEGVFLRFDAAEISRWLRRPEVERRVKELGAAHEAWVGHRYQGRKRPRYPGPVYTMIHSFSHALMTAIALECGYPATALKERIYALSDGDGEGRFGLLIYTATAGAQGTLGGLLSILPRLGDIMSRLLDRLSLCSNDPICSDHRPTSSLDDRALHGAACHSCQLIAETSCEHGNLYLDRELVVPTLTARAAGAFR